jgi:murein DD-endopeptidase MepM/ murein hydrolase activator NlpD
VTYRRSYALVSDFGLAEDSSGVPMSANEHLVRVAHPRRRAVVGLSVALLVAAPRVEAAPCWRPPVEAVVVDEFRAPPCVWCAGNRGLEYAIDATTTVAVAASGRVEFVGAVAGVRYVVVRLPNGWRHTYGQLRSTSVDTGDIALAGGTIGLVTDRFFFGLRIGDDYADPSPYIGVMRTRPRLVPIDATPPRPAPPARPMCDRPPAPPTDERSDAIGAVGSSLDRSTRLR